MATKKSVQAEKNKRILNLRKPQSRRRRRREYFEASPPTHTDLLEALLAIYEARGKLTDERR